MLKLAISIKNTLQAMKLTKTFKAFFEDDFPKLNIVSINFQLSITISDEDSPCPVSLDRGTQYHICSDARMQ